MDYLCIMVRVLLNALLCALLMFGLGCGRERGLSDESYNELCTQLKEGDLLFRRGTGVVGRIVTTADREGMYSHVGVVAMLDGEWCVVHAVPHEPDFDGDYDRVKCESVASFLGRYAEADFGLYRPIVADSVVGIAVANARRLSRAGVHFDHDYDLSDTTSLYCTEFVEYVYRLGGVSLSEGRRSAVTFPGMSGDYIMPSDLTRSSHLRRVTLIY